MADTPASRLWFLAESMFRKDALEKPPEHPALLEYRAGVAWDEEGFCVDDVPVLPGTRMVVRRLDTDKNGIPTDEYQYIYGTYGTDGFGGHYVVTKDGQVKLDVKYASRFNRHRVMPYDDYCLLEG